MVCHVETSVNSYLIFHNKYDCGKTRKISNYNKNHADLSLSIISFPVGGA